MRLGFMGTPDFSINTLQALVDAGHDVAVVYTQPPRAKGRGKHVSPCPVHAHAEGLGITVLNPVKFECDADIAMMKSFELDALVVVAYGIVLPQSILDVPKLGSYNGHASLLPRWRGAAPIQRAIAAGDTETGVCIMKMDAGLDTGDVISEVRVDITAKMNAGQLHDILSTMTGEAITLALKSVVNSTMIATPQTDSGVCYANKLLKSESTIDWNDAAVNIFNYIRAFNPFPLSSTQCGDMVVKILEASVSDIPTASSPVGSVISVKPLIVACGDGALEILTLQKPGKKPVSSKEFLNGFTLKIGDIIGA